MHRGYIQSWNLIVERRFPRKFVASLGYVGSRRPSGASRFSTSTRRRSPAPATKGGRSSRRSAARRPPGSGTAARTASTTRCRPRSNRRFSDGLLLKAPTRTRGPSTRPLLRLDRVHGTRSSVFDRNRAAATHNIPHNFQIAFVYELPFGADKKWATSGASARHPRRLAVERPLQRLPGPAVHAHRVGRLVEHAGQPADARPDQRQCRTVRQCRRRRHVLRHDCVRAGHRGAVRQRRPQHDARARRGEPGPEPVPHVQAHASSSSCSSAAEAFNVSNTPHFANPNGNVNSSNFGRVLATHSAYAIGRSREFRFGLRLTF